MSYEFTKKNQTLNFFTYLAFFSVICSLLLMLLGVIGYRYNIFNISTSLLTLTKYGAYGCILGLSLSFVAFGDSIQRKANIYELLLLLCTGIISIVFIFKFYNYNMFLKSQPYINDISTNYTSNIEFIVYKEHNNSVGGDSKINLQRYGGYKQPYMDINPLLLPDDKTLIIEEVLEVMSSMGLQVVYIGKEKGIIEAVDISFWYGFYDDFIVRIEPLASGMTSIDARSASRVGKSDFGVNAERIRTFMELLKARL